MRWLPRLSRMCCGPVRPMRRMRHSPVQMRMRCRHCWLRSLWLQLRRRLHALERLGLGQRLLVEAARHAGACPDSSSSGPWGCKTQVARLRLQDCMAGCDQRRSAAANVLLSGSMAIAARARALIS